MFSIIVFPNSGSSSHSYWLEICDSFGNFENPIYSDSLINTTDNQGSLQLKFPSNHYYTPQNLMRIRSSQPDLVSSFKNFNLIDKPRVFFANKVIVAPSEILTLHGVGFNTTPNQLFVQLKNRWGNFIEIYPIYLNKNTIQIRIPDTLNNGVYSLKVYNDSIFKYINYNLIRIANNNHLKVFDPVPSQGYYLNYNDKFKQQSASPVEIYSNENRNLALMYDGTLSVWGDSSILNGVSNYYIPENLKNVVDLDVNQYNIVTLLWDGTMRYWGNFLNKYNNSLTAILINSLDTNNKNILAVYSNRSEIIALDTNQNLVGFSPVSSINSHLAALNQYRFNDVKLGEHYNVFLPKNQTKVYITNAFDSLFIPFSFNYQNSINKIVYGEDAIYNYGLAYNYQTNPLFKPFIISNNNQAQFIDTNLFLNLNTNKAKDFSIGDGIFSILKSDSSITETIYNSSVRLLYPFPTSLKRVTNFVSGKNYTLALYNPFQVKVSLNNASLGYVDSIYYVGFNDSVTIQISPISGYKVDSVVINGTQKLPVYYNFATQNVLNYVLKGVESDANILFILKPIGNLSRIASYKSNSYAGSSFSGTGGSNAYIVLPELDLKNSDYTVELWFKDNGAVSNYERIFDFGTIGGMPNGQGALLAFYLPTSGFVLHNNNADIIIPAPANFNLLTWNHIAFVMSNNRLLFYINGVKTLDTPQPYATASFLSNYIGRSNWPNDPPTNGNFEDIRIWKTARSAQDILTHFYDNLNGNEPGLLYWLPLNNHHKYIQNIPIQNNTALANAAITNIALTDSAYLHGSKANIITTIIPNFNLISNTSLNINNYLIGFGKMYNTNQFYTFSTTNIYTSQPQTPGNFQSVYAVNYNLFNSTFQIVNAKQLNINGDLLVLGLDFNNNMRFAKVPPASPGNIRPIIGGVQNFMPNTSLDLYGLSIYDFAYNINGSNQQIVFLFDPEPVVSFNNSNQYIFIGNLDTVNYTVGQLTGFYCGFKIYAVEFVNNIVYIIDKAGNLYSLNPKSTAITLLAKNLTNGDQVSQFSVNPLNNNQLYVTTLYNASPIIYNISQNNYVVVNVGNTFLAQGAIGLAPSTPEGTFDVMSQDTASNSIDYFINHFSLNAGQYQSSTTSISDGIYYKYDNLPRLLGSMADSDALNTNTNLSLSLDSGKTFYNVTQDRNNRNWRFFIQPTTNFKYGDVLLKKVSTSPIESAIIDQFKVIIVPDTPQHIKAKTVNNLIKIYFDTPSYAGGAPITQYAVYNNRNRDVTYGSTIPITPYISDQNQTYRFYVTAINAAGESFPSQWTDTIFAHEVFKITTSINYGGIISDSSFQLIRSHFRITYSTLPNFKIDSVLINGINIGNDSLTGYTFRNMYGDSTIQVFVTDTHSINFIDDLFKIGRDPNNTQRGVYFLRRDLDFKDPNSYLSGVVNPNFISNEGFPPIRFNGSFYGNFFHLKNLYINLPNTDTVGLFNLFGNNQIVTGLVLDNPQVLGRDKVGSLFGFINSCSNNMNQLPNNNLTNKVFNNGVNGGMINGYDIVGGLIGENYGAIIYNCFAKTTIKGTNWVGGLVGRNDNRGLLFNSFAGSKVFDIDTFTVTPGGFFGVNSGNSLIHDCYAVSDVFDSLKRQDIPNGFLNYGASFGCQNEENSVIYNCFSTNKNYPFLGHQSFNATNYSNIDKASILISEDSFTHHPTQFIFNSGHNFPRIKDFLTQDTLFYQFVTPALQFIDSSKAFSIMQPKLLFGETISVSKINENQLIDSLFINNIWIRTDSLIRYTSSGLTQNDTYLFIFKSAQNYIKIDTQIIGNGILLFNMNNPYNYYLKGSTIRVQFIPQKGYHVDSIWVNNMYSDSLSSFTFNSINQNQLLRVKFAINKYTLFTKSIGKGRIDTTMDYNYGSKVVIKWYPQMGYTVDSIELLSTYRLFQDSLIIDSLLFSDSLIVRFNYAKYSISSLSIGNGSIIPNRDTMIRFIDTLHYKFIANMGYYIDSVLVNDSLIRTLDTLLLTNIYHNTLIKVLFKPIPQNSKKILITYSNGGIVLPKYGINYVDSNGKFIITTVPDSSYRVDSFIVNNNLVDSINSFTIDSVKTDYLIKVIFGNFDYKITTSIGNGIISSNTYLRKNDSFRITYEPLPNYLIDSIFINGILTNDSTKGYTFKNINRDQSIRVVCKPVGFAPRVLNLRLFIEGYFNGFNAMRSVLQNAFNNGCNTCPNNSLYSDSIVVTLIGNNNTMNMVSKIVLDTNGYGQVLLDNNLPNMDYYIKISGRNFVSTYSALPISFNFRTIVYDFTTLPNKAFGNNMVVLPNGFAALYSGILITRSTEVSLDDILISKIGINNYLNGYVIPDVNGDGIITNDDVLIINRNFLKIIQIMAPFN